MKRFAVVLLLAAVLVACSTTPPVAPTPLLVPQTPGFLASTQIADITPPLHLSLFGHGPESRVATGVRLRLRCEVFVIASAGEVVALVPCDLQSSSMALVHAIAGDLARAGVPIPASRIFLMATHTHAAPGHYFEARHYSGPFSSSIPGYDQQVVDFLAARISSAIGSAFATLRPACVGWHADALPGFTFNRSYVPYLANDGPLQEDPERAVDPSVFTLRIEARAGAACDPNALLGVLAVFGMHPTGVPNTNELYHGDIFGFAVRTAEACLARGSADSSCDAEPGDGRIVVGLANGLDGDVSPKIDFQSVPQARKIGRALGRAIARVALETPQMQDHGDVIRAYWELDFAGGWSDDRPEHRLCDAGELGMAAAGGARDGPTRVRILPQANAGFHPPEPYGCHRYKVPLRAAFSSPYDFPRSGPIALVKIGDGFFATAPGELTTVTGLRIREALQPRLQLPGKPTTPIAIVGLTNQYFQYFATREEYDFQYYEGASTLYGPYSAQFLLRHFTCLADVFNHKPNACGGRHELNTAPPLDASPAPKVTRWPDDTNVEFVNTQPMVVCPKQRDGARGWELEIDALPLLFTSDRDLFSVVVLDGAQVIDDDRGSSIEVREVQGRDRERWRVRWTPDLDPADPRWSRPLTLEVRGRVHARSRPFTMTATSTPGCEP